MIALRKQVVAAKSMTRLMSLWVSSEIFRSINSKEVMSMAFMKTRTREAVPCDATLHSPEACVELPEGILQGGKCGYGMAV